MTRVKWSEYILQDIFFSEITPPFFSQKLNGRLYSASISPSLLPDLFNSSLAMTLPSGRFSENS